MAKCKTKFDLMHLCTPATIYFVLSLLGLILLGVSNLGNENTLCIGDYKCDVQSNTVVFVLNAIYILFWTFILDLMCKNGYSSLSWFILLLPFIIYFLILFFFQFYRDMLNVYIHYLYNLRQNNLQKIYCILYIILFWI